MQVTNQLYLEVSFHNEKRNISGLIGIVTLNVTKVDFRVYRNNNIECNEPILRNSNISNKIFLILCLLTLHKYLFLPVFSSFILNQKQSHTCLSKRNNILHECLQVVQLELLRTYMLYIKSLRSGLDSDVKQYSVLNLQKPGSLLHLTLSKVERSRMSSGINLIPHNTVSWLNCFI